MKGKSIEKYLVLYLPWGLALLFEPDPVLSYIIAWLGSILIFYLTLSGWVVPLPKDRRISEQLMRPIFLVQVIFAGYMAVATIFYFLNLLGYVDFLQVNDVIDQQKLELAATCQRYYVLGHAAFVTGMVAFMKYPVKQVYKVDTGKLANTLLFVAIITLVSSFLFLKIPALSQFYVQLTALSFIAGTLALAFAIPQKKLWNIVFCIFLYISNFYNALISGFKEPIIISVLVLGIFLYPNYKKIVSIVFMPVLIMLFYFLPTYNAVYRQNAWSDEVNADEAYKIALDETLKGDQSDKQSSWDFLSFRLSEIDMFTTFVNSTPKYVDFYGFKLLDQSFTAVVPRAFWPSKPSTEALVMERVYDAGVVNRGANVSAKPAFIVDAYLSGGALGVFIALFIYGAVVQLISLKAEQLFGGYILGTALIFSGLFQIFWRGLSFEFLINSVFWSYVSMLLIFRIFKATRILTKI
ncbi:MAG TPA: hypothetical protein VNW95_13785 [Mucilaginibacter sp.]|jgi:hypothetical protein|nr:hypothetical protein [Mucilaginibacter sp.]